MTGAEALIAELSGLCEEHGIEVSAVVTRSGTPIAWKMPNGHDVCVFAVLSATIFGASEAVCSEMGKAAPSWLFIDFDDGLLVVTAIGKKALFAGMCPKGDERELTNVIGCVVKKLDAALFV